MRKHTLTALGGISALIVSSQAQASYTGLSFTVSQANVGGTVRNVFRVYANFSSANDYLTSVFGSPQGGAMTIESRNLFGGAGSAFINPVSSHGTAPDPTEVFGGSDVKTNPIPPIPNAAYDTFFTIGVGAGQAGTGVNGANEVGSQEMPGNFINGNAFTTSNAGWYTNGPAEQGRAGWLGDGDSQNRVLMMQLTVSSTSTVRGTVNISGVNDTGLAGQSFILYQQVFDFIPGPSAMSLLFLGGLFSTRRRRT